MGIVVLLVSGYLFNRRIRRESDRDKLMLWGAVLVYFIFSLFLNWYLREVYEWNHGIPGSDLQNYFEGAEALKKGVKLSELTRISKAFEVTFIHLGYIIYVVFIAVTALSPIIFSLEISLQILYCVQGFAAITAVLNVADFLADSNHNTQQRNHILWVLLLCASVLQMSAILMRDIWILFFISCLMKECKKENSSLLICFFYILASFVFRYYTLVITIPILLGYQFEKKKTAVIVSAVVFGSFFFGQDIINAIARYVGIGWFYQYHFDLYSLASYIMFPSPVSQAYNVQHMNTSYHAIFGGNTEWIYYMLSCWNVFVFPVAIYGVYRGVKGGEGKDVALWAMIIVNIAMLMCLFYNATSSPRHKLLIVISLAFFFKKGYEAIQPVIRVIYFYLVLFILIALLFIGG